MGGRERSREIWRKIPRKIRKTFHCSFFLLSFCHLSRRTGGMFMLMRICSLIHILDLILILRYMNHKKRDSEFISWNYKRRHKIFYHFANYFGEGPDNDMHKNIPHQRNASRREMKWSCFSRRKFKMFYVFICARTRRLFIFEDFRFWGFENCNLNLMRGNLKIRQTISLINRRRTYFFSLK